MTEGLEVLRTGYLIYYCAVCVFGPRMRVRLKGRRDAGRHGGSTKTAVPDGAACRAEVKVPLAGRPRET